MATVHWSGVSGDWSTASDWSTDIVPGPFDKAVIAAHGSYTVTVSTPEAVDSILLNDPGAILDIQSTLAVSGPVNVKSGTLDVGGTLTDSGTLSVRSGGTLLLDGTIRAAR